MVWPKSVCPPLLCSLTNGQAGRWIFFCLHRIKNRNLSCTGTRSGPGRSGDGVEQFGASGRQPGGNRERRDSASRTLRFEFEMRQRVRGRAGAEFVFCFLRISLALFVSYVIKASPHPGPRTHCMTDSINSKCEKFHAETLRFGIEMPLANGDGASNPEARTPYALHD